MRAIVIVTNKVPDYRVSLFRHLGTTLRSCRLWVTGGLDHNCREISSNSGMPVEAVSTLRIPVSRRHPGGFRDDGVLLVPLGLLGMLFIERPRIVISSELGIRTLLTAIYVRASRATKLVLWLTLSERTEAGRGLLRILVRKYLIRTAALVFTNGESGVRYCTGLGAPQSSICVVPYSIDAVPFLAVRRRSNDGPVARLLYVGQMIERKGIEPWLRMLFGWAVNRPSRCMTVRMVGEGPLRSHLMDLEPPDNVKIVWEGPLKYDQVIEAYSSADAFLFPTLADEWGVVVSEAMCAGLPVLGSLFSEAVCELVEDGVTGWIFDPTSVRSVEGALDRVFETDARALATMSELCRERGKRCDCVTVGEKMKDFLRRVDPDEGNVS